MTALQLTMIFAGLLVLLGVIGFALVRQTLMASGRRPAIRTKEAPIAEKPLERSEASSAPQERKRRLVTDFAIKHDPLASSGQAVPQVPQVRTFSEVERQLEVAFDELQSSKISLDTYRSIVEREEVRVRDDIARLSTTEGEGSAALKDAQRAMDLIRYCLEWKQAQ